jgi:hypothetical protein
MSYFFAKDVHQHFTRKGWSGNFWNDMVVIDDITYIPVKAVSRIITSEHLKEMETQFMVFIPQPKQSKEEIAINDLLIQLSQLAIEYDRNEYGLPIDIPFQKAYMVDIVKDWLKSNDVQL